MFLFQGAQPCSVLYSPSVWRKRLWQCAGTPPARTFPLILWPWCHRKRSWMSRKFRWLPQVCEREIFSASEPGSDFGATPGIPTVPSVPEPPEMGPGKSVFLRFHRWIWCTRLPNMVVHCTAWVENWLHRDCLRVTDTSSWGLSTNTFLY